MPLLDMQAALGRMVRVPALAATVPQPRLTCAEEKALESLLSSAGFQFTVEVQRSWCTGHASKGAWLTLSTLPPATRDSLLEEWVAGGGGTASFVASESDTFLEFIAARLADPSHALTVCRMEQATLRASEGARHFHHQKNTILQSPKSILRKGTFAGLVKFHCEPRLLLASLGQPSLPPITTVPTPVLFAPGLNSLFRIATSHEASFLEELPATLESLLAEGHPSEMMEDLAAIGAIEEGTIS